MNLLDKKLKKNRILLFDGAIGTNIKMPRRLSKSCYEELNLYYPEIVEELHRKYVNIGVDFITTNTFGGNSIKLKGFNLSRQVMDINRKAVKIAAKVAGDDVGIAGSIGPTGSLIQPLGMLSFDSAVDAFFEQALILKKAGVDILILETFTDIAELRAAAIAACEVDIPFIACMSFDEGKWTITGTTASAFAVTMTHLGASALGINCGTSPRDYPELIGEIARYTHLPILSGQNAGIPRIENGKTVFPASLDEIVNNALADIKAGARIIGGCCGITPEAIRKIKESVKSVEYKEAERSVDLFHASSRTETFTAGDGKVRIIGERINPTGKKKLSAELLEGKLTRLRQEAISQQRAGADAIDVNVAVPGVDEHRIMQKTVHSLGSIVSKCLFIDTSNRKAAEVALREYHGRAVLNSITASERDLSELLPIVAKYGSAFVAMPIDEDGIPDSAKGRLLLAKKILKRAKKHGIEKNRILFDILVLPIGSDSNHANIAIDTLRLYRENGLYTTAGVSNISYGLPARDKLNSAFLELLTANGIDTAIADPTSDAIGDDACCFNLLSGNDKNATEYIAYYSDYSRKDSETDFSPTLKDDIERGEKQEAIAKINALLDDNVPPLDIINNKLIPAIKLIGDKFERREVFLPIVISAAETVKSCMDFLEPYLQKSQDSIKGRIILATVEGDVHDIGKNLVGTVLSSYGFEIIDLGKNVKTDDIMFNISVRQADALGLSALMTTTMSEMEYACKIIRCKYPDFTIVVGGACIDDDFARKIGATAYAKNAIEAARIFEKLLRK